MKLHILDLSQHIEISDNSVSENEIKYPQGDLKEIENDIIQYGYLVIETLLLVSQLNEENFDKYLKDIESKGYSKEVINWIQKIFNVKNIDSKTVYENLKEIIQKMDYDYIPSFKKEK